MTIYFDMDGVLCDFEHRCDELDCWKPDIHKCNWKKMEEIGHSFWSDMNPIQHGLDLINQVAKLGYDVGIFSAVHLDCGKQGKREWLQKYLPNIPKKNIIIVRNGNMKHKFAIKDSILIDDKPENVANYKMVGEKAILYTNELSLNDILDVIGQ